MLDYRSSTLQPNDVIVDLSRHINKILAYEDISDDLNPEEEMKLVEFVRQTSQMSYDKISRRYKHWKDADRAHDVYVPPEATKFREKAVIADTRAISDTVRISDQCPPTPPPITDNQRNSEECSISPSNVSGTYVRKHEMGSPFDFLSPFGAFERTGEANINHFLETYSYSLRARTSSICPLYIDHAVAALA